MFKKSIIIFLLQVLILLLILNILIVYNNKKIVIQNKINYNVIYAYSKDIIEKFEGLKLKPYQSYENTTQYYVCRGNSYNQYQQIFKTKIISKNNCDYLFDKIYYMILNEIKKSALKLQYNSQYVAIISLCYNIKKNFINFKKSKLYQLLTQEIQDNEKIIIEWLDFSKVNGLIDCKILKRNKETLIIFFKEYKTKEKEEAYSILEQEYNKYDCVK